MARDVVGEILDAASNLQAKDAVEAAIRVLAGWGYTVQHGAGDGWLTVRVADLEMTLDPPPDVPQEELVRVRQAMGLLTERARDWWARMRTEQRMATFSEACFEGLFVLDGHRLVDGNEYLYVMLGYPRSELLESDILELCFPHTERSAILEMLGRGASGQVVLARRKDGRDLAVELRSKPVVVGKKPLCVAAIRDVTEREEAQALLRERERHLAEWASVAFTATVVSDGITILEAGGRTFDLVGYEPAELVGRGVLEFVAAPSRRLVERVVNERHIGAYEVVLRHKSGDPVPVEIVSALSTWRGKSVRFAGLRDRREVRKLETERWRLEQSIERGHRLQSWGTLAAGISHDFGNLLVGITANAEVLMESCSDPAVAQYAREIHDAGRRASDLVSELLTFDGESHSLSKEIVDVGELLVELRRMLSAKLAPNATVVMRIEPRCTVLGNRARLSQVFMNLLTNASDSLEGDPGEIIVSIEVVNELDARWDEAWGARLFPGRHVLVEIRDTGVGMEASLIERAFEPFFTTKHAGNGLGLAACLGTLRAHDGAIHVTSEPSKGTRFSVVIPARTHMTLADAERASTAARRACHVFVLDDEPAIRAQIRRSLELRGYRVTDASDVDQAETLLGDIQPDALLVDLVLGDRDGAEFLSRMRERGVSAPAVLLSGFIDPRLEEALSPGTFQAFLRKPYSVHQLVETLEHVLQATATEHSHLSQNGESGENWSKPRFGGAT